MILSIESSCDDTSLALTDISTYKLLFHTKLSQDSSHQPFGGVVPEIASRLHAQNLPLLLGKLKSFLLDSQISTDTSPFAPIKAIAVTNRPGLSITLSEGVCMANALSLSLKVPVLYLNHLKGHIYSLFIGKPATTAKLGILLVSGGHTQLLLMQDSSHIALIAQTLDDSFGESFDKAAKMLNLSYPGGPIIEQLARQNSQELIPLPLPLAHDKSLHFSFSGLKNALRLKIQAYKQAHNRATLSQEDSQDLSFMTQICASFQNIACAHILDKTQKFFEQYDFELFGVVGGASANLFLREKLQELCTRFGRSILYADLDFCQDNAAMIGRLAIEQYHCAKDFKGVSDVIYPKSLQDDFIL